MTVANPLSSLQPKIAAKREFGILVFAKSPRPGTCKTRLARGCGGHRAACLYRAMVEHALACARVQCPGAVTLFCAPDTGHPFFARMARRYRVPLVRQARGDLGQRMHHAIAWGLGRYRRVVLIGSDQPQLGGHWASTARGALTDPQRAWLATTYDGGYWAIGLRRAEARLFRGPRWSTARVARVTRQRGRALGLVWGSCGPRGDIDEWRDWQRLAPAIRGQLARAALMPGLIRAGS